MTGLFSGIRRRVAHLRRYRHIMAVLMKYGFEEVAGILARRLKVGIGSKGLPTAYSQEIAQASLARRVRLAMEELGPTFIKLGQLLSTRPDLLPTPYIEELERLQDQVTPEKSEVIRHEIRRQLGAIQKLLHGFRGADCRRQHRSASCPTKGSGGGAEDSSSAS